PVSRRRSCSRLQVTLTWRGLPPLRLIALSGALAGGNAPGKAASRPPNRDPERVATAVMFQKKVTCLVGKIRSTRIRTRSVSWEGRDPFQASGQLPPLDCPRALPTATLPAPFQGTSVGRMPAPQRARRLRYLD